MITLYLARHGQTEENIARIFQGHMPGTLTVEGIAQAEALRDTLRNISLDAVVSSDLKPVCGYGPYRCGRSEPALGENGLVA